MRKSTDTVYKLLTKVKNIVLNLLFFVWEILTFIPLIISTVFYLILSAFVSLPLVASTHMDSRIAKYLPTALMSKLQQLLTRIHRTVAVLFEWRREDTISRVDLMEFSFRTIWMKKSRSLVTVGGISFAIAFIVFLVSLGFGLQGLIIDRAVRLNQLSQADVSPGLSETLKLDDNVIARFKGIENVESVYPVIASVGKVQYKGSSFNISLYGAPSDYLTGSGVVPIVGDIYNNSLTSVEVSQALSNQELVKGASLQVVELDQDVDQPTTGVSNEVGILAAGPREIVVNVAFLDLIGVESESAVGEIITLQVLVLGELLEEGVTSLTSVPTQYTIVGVVEESSVPLGYIPFVDIRSMGVNSYSTLNVTVEDSEDLAQVRLTIETLGYVTTSVADTVNEIEGFFGNLRIVLGAFGLVALGVASLGMFNTLTVSLMERTHEVGLLKAMGMRSAEIRELFLSESMIMGFFGGVCGLLIGMALGEFTESVLTSISTARGGGAVLISDTPTYFILAIILLSLALGLLTGWYPAMRATRISALNALRYE